nr:ribokinase [Pseudomonadales bacterium]
GKGANQAVAAARGGCVPVRLLAAMGDDDLGASLLEQYRTEDRLSLDLIHKINGGVTGVATILVDPDGENMICVAPGANAHLQPAQVTAMADDVFQDCGVLLASNEIPLDTVAACIQRAALAGMRVILNPAPVIPQLAEHPLLKSVYLLTPNEHEARLLSGIEVTDFVSAISSARAVQQMGVEHVIITLGSQGVIVVPREGQSDPWCVQAPRVAAVDTTAAGDCFNGLLAAELAHGKDLEQAVEFAVRGASLSVTCRGAQTSLPTRQEIVQSARGETE